MFLVIPEKAAVYEEGGAGDVGAIIGSDESRDGGDVRGFAETIQRNILKEIL